MGIHFVISSLPCRAWQIYGRLRYRMAIVFNYSEMKSLCFIKNSKTYLMEWKGESVKGEKCIHGSAFSQESPKSQTKINFLQTIIVNTYYLAESVSRQDEANPAFWLATWASISCPLKISRVGPARKCYLFVHILNLLLTKLVRSWWLYVGLALFWIFNCPRRKRRKELGQYTAILTSRLVNNAYIIQRKGYET